MAVITRISTNEALMDGGTEIVVTGRGFTGASKVFFEDPNTTKTDAQSFTIDSDTQITVISPKVRNLGDSWVCVVVQGKENTTPLEETVVPDGDSLKSTGTYGVTTVLRPNDANKLRMVGVLTRDLNKGIGMVMMRRKSIDFEEQLRKLDNDEDN